MSEVGRSARVNFTVADYVAPGQSNKMTIVGAGITIVVCNPATRRTAPISVIATISFDAKFLGESPNVELSLEADDGTVVEVPTIVEGSPDQTTPGLSPLRVDGASLLQPTVLDGLDISADAVRPKVQLLMQFQNGLPLEPGRRYLWRITIDDETRDEWTDWMYVPTAAIGPGPVVG